MYVIVQEEMMKISTENTATIRQKHKLELIFQQCGFPEKGFNFHRYGQKDPHVQLSQGFLCPF